MLAAETRLAELDWFEDLAELHDTEESLVLRRQFAEQYRRIIGVHPQERAALRLGLERLRGTGAMAVEDLISRMGH